MSHPASHSIRIDDQLFPISELTEFGFTAGSSFPLHAVHGQLLLGDSELETDFYVRHERQPHCFVFSNVSTEQREQVRLYLAKQNEVLETSNPDSVANDSPDPVAPKVTAAGEKVDIRKEADIRKDLEDIKETTSSLASRITQPAQSVASGTETPRTEAPRTETPSRSEPRPSSSPRPPRPTTRSRPEPVVTRSTGAAAHSEHKPARRKKLWIVLPWLLVAGLLANKFWPDGSKNGSIAVSPSAQGEITQVLVGNGDKIKKGDLLVQLSQQPTESQVSSLVGELELAAANLKAAEESLAACKKKIKLIDTARSTKLAAAEKERAAAAKELAIAKQGVDRVRPFFESGSISQIEFERIEMTMLAANKKWLEKDNKVENLQFAIKAAESKILVDGNKVSDELAQLEIQYELAHTKHDLLKKQSQATQAGATLCIYAPCDGEVKKIARKVGDFVKTDDNLIYVKQTH